MTSIPNLSEISLFSAISFSTFEFGMLACFGICWPVSVFKSIKSKRTEGKSLLFLIIVFLGYLSGLTGKLLYRYDYVTILYLSNTILVLVDIILYLKYSRFIAPPPATMD